jgi:acyl-CoA thioester hydrolase
MSFTYPVRVYYEDTDAGGVVYYANYLKFFERARTEMLRAMGYEQDELKRDAGVLFVIRSVQVNYIRPALFNNLLQVSATVSHIKKASLIFEQTISRDNTLLCTATVEVACVKAENFRPSAIPVKLVAHFEQSKNK